MLLGNYSVLTKSPGRFSAGSTVSDNRSNWSKSGQVRAFLNEIPISAIPNGCTPPVSWGIARKSGGIACYTGAVGLSNVANLNLAGGLAADAALTGSGDITLANVLYIIVANAALVGSGDITSNIKGGLEAQASLAGSGDILATIAAALSMEAALVGSGDVTGGLGGALQALADLVGSGDVSSVITGKIDALASLAGSGDITQAQSNAIWDMVSSILSVAGFTSDITGKGNIVAIPDGTGNVTANPGAKASMGADITVTGEFLTTSNVGPIVLEYVKPDLEIINNGVKKSSLIIPHSQNLT